MAYYYRYSGNNEGFINFPLECAYPGACVSMEKLVKKGVLIL